MKKTIALILSLCLLLAVLAGCGKSSIQNYSDEEIAAAEQAAEEAAEAADPKNAYPADTLVATINGSEITWDEYYYWLNNYRATVENSFGAITDWNALNAYYTSNTNEEVVRTLAQSDALYYHMILAEAEAQSVTVAPEDVESQILTDIDLAFGDGNGVLSEEENDLFNTEIAAAGMTRDLYTRIVREALTEQALFEASTAATTDEEVLTWAAEQGYMNAKHILILTVDETTREALSEEEIAAAKTTAEELYAQLSEAYVPATEDNSAFLAMFDGFMMNNSQDTGLATNPDGYIFLPGEMVAPFEEAVQALDENYAMSGVVESDFGYHIILRQPIAADTVLGQNAYGADVTMATAAKSTMFNTYLQEQSMVAEIVWEEGFETLSMAELFG